ncbi:hypothetical protein AMK68_03330 [candidate division KD3-62 bacterium DG_56]|uniref:Uncharacterized protein n=1 Tax=candidate division KD3-62 bacterium DG_56 TaxID=1704032 RepID=A0A0S7XMK5_9BACT|nr:MAG: hypothetical protein AMK68_03330 [candidate division KD3-62 bacterium DG_56]
MSMVFLTGAEPGNALEWDLYNVTATGVQRRSGAYSFGFPGPGFYAQTNLTAPGLAQAYLQFAWRTSGFTGGPTQIPIVKWRNGANVLGVLAVDKATQLLVLYTGDFGILVGTATAPVNTATWHVFEIYISIANVGGQLVVRINGVPDPGLSFTGDTQPAGDTTFDNLYFMSWRTGSQYWTGWIDDVILNDLAGGVNDSWPNGARIVYLPASGVGNSSQWTPLSLPQNWQEVDEVPVSQADYVHTNAQPRLDLYNLQNLPADAQAVQAARADAWALMSGAATPTTLKPAVRTGGAPFFGPAQGVPLILTLLSHIWDQNPNTLANWTPADVNAAESGQESAP